MTPKRSDSVRTQQLMIRTAERLFAERGIDSVSLSEINREAGQRNKSALTYHFGSREGLLKAILERHHAVIESRRSAMMAELGPIEEAPLVTLLELAVRPIASLLDEEDGGTEYLRIMGQLMPTHPINQWIASTFTPTFLAIIEGIRREAVWVPETLQPRRYALVGSMIYFALSSATYEPTTRESRASVRELQFRFLIDNLRAVLTTPPSAELALLMGLDCPTAAGLGDGVTADLTMNVGVDPSRSGASGRGTPIVAGR